jgi:hypothetical protein
VPDEGLRVVVPRGDPRLEIGSEFFDAAVNAALEPFLGVSSANHRSTRFNHDELVGVK